MCPTSKTHLLWPSYARWRKRLSITSSSKISVSYSKEHFWISLSKTKRCALSSHFHWGYQDSFSLYVTTYLVSFLLQVLMETAGGALSIDNQDPGTHGFRPSRQDVFEFIKQCGEGDVSFQCVRCQDDVCALKQITPLIHSFHDS